MSATTPPISSQVPIMPTYPAQQIAKKLYLLDYTYLPIKPGAQKEITLNPCKSIVLRFRIDIYMSRRSLRNR